MSLINVEKTNAEKLNEIKLNIIANNANAIRKVQFVVKHNFDQVWNNPQGYTPQQVLDTFGTQTRELFIASKATEDYIKSIDDSWVYLFVPYELTFNEDGTVTVGDKIEELPV